MRQKKYWIAMRAILTAMVLMLPVGAVAASTSKVLYKFKGGNDAGHPFDGLIFDPAVVNLYGTSREGGGSTCGGNNSPCGTVFMLTPNSNGSWKESVLYRFKGGNDGWSPLGGLILDGVGNLYGTTLSGGSSNAGTVFRLTPSSNGSWTESVLYSFCQLTNCADGIEPLAGVTLDGSGNLYCTTLAGGASGGGIAFKLTPNSEGNWTESVLQSFGGPVNGGQPNAGLIFDAAGNLYGTTSIGGAGGGGTVFKLTPNSDGSWTEHVLHTFTGGKDGGGPLAGLTFDAAGNLYGTTSGINGAGRSTVFKLTPKPHGGWKESVLHHFTKDTGANPYAGVTFDTAGNLYGTTVNGGLANDGVVFKLAQQQGGGWTYSVLYPLGGAPGRHPYGGVILDKTGNLFGTTSDCAVGNHCVGIVFEVTP
jgi:uncharacterized repeat protein (TIGR03803 family)